MPTTLASDDFNRSNEAPLASPWVKPASFPQTMALTGNVTTSTSPGSSDAVAYYSGVTWPADQWAQATIAESTNFDGGPAVRIHATNGNAYVCTAAGGGLQIGKFVAAAYSALGATAVTNANGDVWRIEATGSASTVITVFQNGIQRLQVTDSTSPHTSGNAGMFNYLTTLDNFSAGDFSSVARYGPDANGMNPNVRR